MTCAHPSPVVVNRLSCVRSTRRVSRRGSIYLLVLGSTLIVAVLGLGGLQAVRSQVRSANLLRDSSAAADLALSAIAHGRLKLIEDSAWRTNYASGAWSTEQTLGSGTFSWKIVDASTGGSVLHAGVNPLSDTATVKICGKGRVGSVLHITTVQLAVTKNPYDAVKTALYAGGSVALNSSTPLTVSGAPLAAAGIFSNTINFTGNVEAAAIFNSGTITGTQTSLASPKTTPPNSVWDIYFPLATPIPWNTSCIASSSGKYNFKTNILTPTLSNFTTPVTNADGVYYVSVPAGLGKLQIDWIRINGTILFDVQGSGTTVHFGAHILWSPFRADYPMAIIRNAQTVELDSLTAMLAEGTNNNGAGNANYNPTGFPYNGVSNTNTTDANYVSRLYGLIHVMGGVGITPTTTNIYPQLHSIGCVITPGAVNYTGGSATPDASLVWDPALASNPPLGYYTLKATPVAGSWKQELAP
jgi:hypothetical protein